MINENQSMTHHDNINSLVDNRVIFSFMRVKYISEKINYMKA